MTIRCVIADDQQLVRAGFRRILESEDGIEVVDEASTGSEAVRVVRHVRPDVTLMDVRMPDGNGIDATRELLSGEPNLTRVLILTTFDLDEYVYDALRAGASGFLLKDAPPDDLVAAVRIVAAGDALLAPPITRKVIEEFVRRNPHREPPTSAPPGASLTAREDEVLTLLARGLSNAQIARALVVSEATVKTHVARVLAKLQLPDRVHAVIYAYETGLVTPGS